MSNDEPTFTYKPPTEEEQQAFKAYQAKMAAAAALVSEARAHQWEHKQPAQQLGQATGVGLQTAGRTFTREEVLTVLRAKYAEGEDTRAVRDLIRIFERME